MMPGPVSKVGHAGSRDGVSARVSSYLRQAALSFLVDMGAGVGGPHLFKLTSCF